MINRFSLSLLVFLCAFSFGFGQAILPLDTDGLQRNNLPTGFSYSGLGSDYGSPCGDALRLDNSGDEVTLFFSGVPNVLSYQLKANTGSGSWNGTFTIEESNNGTVWTTLRTITGIGSISTGNSGTTFSDNPLATSQYIRWTYTNEINGNIAMCNIDLSDVPCTPATDPAGTISGIFTACNSTTLTYNLDSSEPVTNTAYYWQTQSDGVLFDDPANTPLNVTSSGDYFVRAYNTLDSCWSNNSISQNVTINVTPSTTNPTDENILVGQQAIFTITATNNPTTYQWQVNEGSGWANVTNGTGDGTASYTTIATTPGMDGNLYRCQVSNACGMDTSTGAILNLSYPTPSNAQSLDGCFDDDSATLTWNHPATQPTGYVIFALEGTTEPTSPPNEANTYSPNPNFNAAPFETPASLGKVIYKGNGTSASLTGLTEGSTYTFRIFAYNGETLTAWSNGTSGGSDHTDIAQDDISNLVAIPDNNQMTLDWDNPTPVACWDQLVIFANEGGPVMVSPSGNGSAYVGNDNDTYLGGTDQLVYESGSSIVSIKTINGLTNGTQYCFKVFIRRGSEWSDGIEICEIPVVTYCASNSNLNDETVNRNVTFNTINNDTPAEQNAYSDFTAISTTLIVGEVYDLSVSVDTDGAYTTHTRAWIDWNHDGDFNDSGEQYELGDAYNVSNGLTSNSPFSIEVPGNATLEPTRMRISTRYNNPATSCQTTSFYGEVEDYTINIIKSPTSEINVIGNNISIPNGFDAPESLNNTAFAARNLATTSPPKSYYIENLGLASLNLNGTLPRVELIGSHAGDFSVTLQPAALVNPNSSEEFRITFTPSGDGIRMASVRIINDDATGGENPYIFDIQGEGICNTSPVSVITPVRGPVGTELTITSSTDLTAATASINGESMPIINSTSSSLVVSVPTNASDGNLVVTFNNGCSSSNSFTVDDNIVNGCDTGSSATPPSDLIISEVTDSTTGSSSFVEIFNGTGNPKDLSDYELKIYNNGNSSPSSTTTLSGTLNSGDTYVISINTTSCSLNGLTASIDLPRPTLAGINFDNNDADAIILEKTSGANQGLKDTFGVVGSGTWANGLSFGSDGVNFRRKNDASILPSTTFSLGDWDIIDWTSCSDSDYSNLGMFDFSIGIPPIILTQPGTPTSDCALTSQISFTAEEGIVGGQSLNYQWWYVGPYGSGLTNWQVVPDNADFNDVSTNTLEIVNALPYDGYQFYCRVRENGDTCFTATNAVKLTVNSSVWDGSNWSVLPAIDRVVILDADYDTTTNMNDETSFSACNLIINNATLTIGDVNNGGINTFVEVENDLTLNGSASIIVHPQGAFVQINDDGDVTANIADNIQVVKETAPMATAQEYTYWSSPVENEEIGQALAQSNPGRRYWFNAQNYKDSCEEDNNDNNLDCDLDGNSSKTDDIDDYAPWDWQSITDATTIMAAGIGYASTHDPSGFAGPGSPPYQFDYVFRGLFNNGVKSVALYRNDDEIGDTNWNLVGNPYPSAIDVDAFFNENLHNPGQAISTDYNANSTGAIDGAIYLWSHNTAPSDTNNGNENINFTQSDYVTINGIGTVTPANEEDPGNSGLSSINRMIPSGQGFFVSMSDNVAGSGSTSIKSADLIFNNAMRVRGVNDNSQFFRNANSENLNKLWLNLTSDNGIFSQILVGYKEGATNGYDSPYFDAKRNTTAGAHSTLYSIIPNVNQKFAIQGKDPNSLNTDEVIPLGFFTSIEEATIYTLSIAQIEGEFLNSNDIYIKDNLLNSVYNLSESNYNFSSETGEFDERFEIVFNPEALSLGDNEMDINDLNIVELQSGAVQFTVPNRFQIKTVEIIDILGRSVYRLKGQSYTEVYNLNELSSAAYIAKVTLNNNQVITKKAIKQK